jgi:protein arginine N-methyltransferase 1
MSMLEMHRIMLRDEARNSAYDRAIRALVKKGDRVLDLGAGTGLLAMMAARAGASEVIAVEAADIHAYGRALTKHNKVNVTWKHVPSTELSLKQKATVLVTETFGSHPFEECAHEFVRDAKKRLCEPDARVIPSRVRTYAAPATFAEKRDDWDLFGAPIAGFDFSPLREETTGQMYAERIEPDALLADAVLLEDIALGGDAKSIRKLDATWQLQRDGLLSGVVQWYELDLAPGIVLSTSPFAPPTHWRQVHYPLDKNVTVKKGERVTLSLALDTRIEVPLDVRYEILVSRRA